MVGWYHQLNGQEFEKTLGDCKGEGSLVCCNARGGKDLDLTRGLNNLNLKLALAKSICEQLNNNKNKGIYLLPLWRLNPVCAAVAVDLQHPLREFTVQCSVLQ